MENVIDYEKHQERPDTGNLGQLSALCQEMLTVRAECEQIEAHLKERKKALQELQASRIPALMAELKMDAIMMSNGVKIVIQRIINCRFNVVNKFNAFEWLDEHGHGSMIKHEVSVDFGRGEGEVAQKAVSALTELGLKPSVSKDVHFQTLSAWARRELEAGHEVPANYFELSILDLAKVK